MLPSSGLLKFSDIRTELGSSAAPFLLHQAEIGTYGPLNTSSPHKPDGSSPSAVSEWYEYTNTPSIHVISVGGSTFPCTGGAINDFIGASISTDVNVDVDSTFNISVSYYVGFGGSCIYSNTASLELTILAGSSYASSDCSNGNYYIGGGDTIYICGACVVYCNNPNVSLSLVGC